MRIKFEKIAKLMLEKLIKGELHPIKIQAIHEKIRLFKTFRWV